MPPLTRWFIKFSFVYLILGLLSGLFLAAQGVWNFYPPAALLFPTYFHLIAEGWITMLIVGVVFWMFPKYSMEKPRRSEELARASFYLLNAGLLLRIISEPANEYYAASVSFWAVLLTLAALLQWLGGMAFVINTWERVKEK